MSVFKNFVILMLPAFRARSIAGSQLLLEDGTSFLLLENSSFLLLET